MIRIVVFDMDGVLCRYRIERRLARLAAWSGHSPETIHAAIWGSGFEAEAERGILRRTTTCGDSVRAWAIPSAPPSGWRPGGWRWSPTGPARAGAPAQHGVPSRDVHE